MKVSIVGGGIMGLATAHALALAGHKVALYEQGALPHAKAGSFDHHRLIRYTYGSAHGYAAMVREAYAAWDRLWAKLDTVLYRETGLVALGSPSHPWIEGSKRSLERLDLPFEVLDGPAIARRWPMLDGRKVEHGLWTPTGGVLLAERILLALLRRCAELGVELHDHTRVRSLMPASARLRLEDGRDVGADALVVAAGPWIGRLVPDLAPRIVPSRQAFAYLEPPQSVAAIWREAPFITDVITGETSVFYAVPPVADTPLKFGDHRFTREGDPDEDRLVSEAHLARVMHLATRRLADPEGYRLLAARTCFYDVTEDERFVARFEGDKTLVLGGFSGHGFKFGALIGEAVAALLAEPAGFQQFRDWLAGIEVARPPP